MAWTVEFSQAAEHDFELIFDHLVSVHIDLGEDRSSAVDRASRRIDDIRRAAIRLGDTPRIGTRRDDMAPGVRSVTRDRAIFWFDLDEANRTVRILAIFHGGQDHLRHMLARLSR